VLEDYGTPLGRGQCSAVCWTDNFTVQIKVSYVECLSNLSESFQLNVELVQRQSLLSMPEVSVSITVHVVT